MNDLHRLDDLTGPKLYRAGGIEIDRALADPSVTFVETGGEFGFLLSESAHDSDVEPRLTLENVLWAKTSHPSGFLNQMFGKPPNVYHRELDRVDLYRHDDGPYVVQDQETGLYLPQPSADPYIVVFIDEEQYRDLADEILHEQRLHAILDDLAILLQGVPDLTIAGEKLIGPGTYARAGRVEFEVPYLQL